MTTGTIASVRIWSKKLTRLSVNAPSPICDAIYIIRESLRKRKKAPAMCRSGRS